jgi:hypothetical protein
MPPFTITPLPASLVDQARGAALADGTAVEVTSNDDARFPVRCCLHDATAEEGVLLLSMQPQTGDSPYAAPGPVYIHRERCAGYSYEGDVPQILRGRTLSLRGYTDEHGRGSRRRRRGRRAAAARRARDRVPVRAFRRPRLLRVSNRSGRLKRFRRVIAG